MRILCEFTFDYISAAKVIFPPRIYILIQETSNRLKQIHPLLTYSIHILLLHPLTFAESISTLEKFYPIPYILTKMSILLFFKFYHFTILFFTFQLSLTQNILIPRLLPQLNFLINDVHFRKFVVSFPKQLVLLESLSKIANFSFLYNLMKYHYVTAKLRIYGPSN